MVERQEVAEGSTVCATRGSSGGVKRGLRSSRGISKASRGDLATDWRARTCTHSAAREPTVRGAPTGRRLHFSRGETTMSGEREIQITPRRSRCISRPCLSPALAHGSVPLSEPARSYFPPSFYPAFLRSSLLSFPPCENALVPYGASSSIFSRVVYIPR